MDRFWWGVEQQTGRRELSRDGKERECIHVEEWEEKEKKKKSRNTGRERNIIHRHASEQATEWGALFPLFIRRRGMYSIHIRGRERGENRRPEGTATRQKVFSLSLFLSFFFSLLLFPVCSRVEGCGCDSGRPERASHLEAHWIIDNSRGDRSNRQIHTNTRGYIGPSARWRRPRL